MARKATSNRRSPSVRRRQFTEEFRRDAVQMMLDGHTAASVAERLGLSGPDSSVPLEGATTPTQRSGRLVARRPRPRTRSRVAPRRAGARHPKKSVGHFRPQRVTDVYAAVEAIARDASASHGHDLRRSRRQSLGVLRLARRREPIAARTANSTTARRRSWRSSGSIVVATGPGASPRSWPIAAIVCSPQASRESPENPGSASDSAEVVRAQDDRQPSPLGLQSEPVARRAGADARRSNCGSATSPTCRCGAAASATWRR